MKTLIPALLLAAFVSCATTKPGPKIEVGTCARTSVIYVFLDEEDQPQGMVPTPPGCRCSVKIDGKEFVPSEVEDDAKCQQKSGQSSQSEQGQSL